VTTRRVDFTDAFWLAAARAFPPYRTDEGRPSIDDFQQLGLPALEHAFLHDELLVPAEPWSPFLLALLGGHPVMPPTVAYGLLSYDPDADLETMTVSNVAVDWEAWRTQWDQDDDW
jgi:hypothetical protein